MRSTGGVNEILPLVSGRLCRSREDAKGVR
jgi:hypothetical protein